MPKNLIFSLFAKSPIKPLQEHMEIVHSCVSLLLPFFQAVFGRDWKQVEKLYKEIVKLEKSADTIKHKLRTKLPRGLFLPVPRNDLLATLRSQDKLANKARDISGLILGRKMEFPEEIIGLMTNYINKCIEASQLASQAIGELDELLETGFSGKEVYVVEDIVHNIDDVEDTTDLLQIELRAKLFEIEERLNPVDVIFLYQIIGRIGDLADRAQKVGSQLLILIAK